MKTQENTKTPRKPPEWLNAVDFDSPKGVRLMLVQIAKRLASGTMKTDMGRTLTAVGMAALKSLEVEHGTKVNVNHSGTIGLRDAEECFARVFGGVEAADVALPTGVDTGPEQAEDMA